jgi:hypothetical protein
MAQFSHADFGGMSQWSPGMSMVGDMFNTQLKAKLDAFCTDIAAHLMRRKPPMGHALTLTFTSQDGLVRIADLPSCHSLLRLQSRRKIADVRARLVTTPRIGVSPSGGAARR